MLLKGQGATEYLVLLAVVLIVALVSVALLGFFPSMASDAQIAQSQMYWRSATPLAVIDAGTRYYTDGGGNLSCINIVIRNTGAYPIRLSKIIGGNTNISTYRDRPAGIVSHNISDLQLAPGEEMCFSGTCGSCTNHEFWIGTGTSYSSSPLVLAGASTICNPDSTGQLLIKDFGFEYIEYIEGQQITKRQMGAKDLMVKCG